MNQVNDITNSSFTGLYTAAQVRAMDRYAIDHEGIAGLELMHRAGQSAFECLMRLWPSARHLAILCGAGNNAGDGYVVARLAKSAGLKVTLLSVVSPDRLSGDAASVYHEFIDDNGRITEFHEDRLESVDIIVDALLGTGLDRDVTGVFFDAINAINCAGKPVFALDIPSGLNADTGYPMGRSVRADCTISFIARKQGLYTGEGIEYSGRKEYASLSVPNEVIEAEIASAELIVAPWQHLGPRNRAAHKGHFGHVLIIGGEQGYSGAALMAACAAARVGAGLVSIATRKAHASWLNLSRPEIMCHGVESADELYRLLSETTVVGIGPGLGQSPWAADLLEVVMSTDLPLVVDADGLNLLSGLQENRDMWVLTPHPGEAARLLQMNTLKINTDRFQAVRNIQKKYGGVCILKGAGTLIYDGVNTHISPTGNPGMASGGMGDVLTGVVVGLIAQGFSTAEASLIGVYLHGAAADRAAESGERGLLASDLFPHLRNLVNP